MELGKALLVLAYFLTLAVVYERGRRKAERLTGQLRGAKLECVAYASRLEAMELLFAEKQAKIGRLQAHARVGQRLEVGDLLPERHLRSVGDAVRDVSDDFDRRQGDYARTGRYQRRTDHLTEEGPPDAA